MVVVFDIGNVLLRWNPRNLFRKVFADEAAMEAFLATAGAMEFVGEADKGSTFGPALEARIAAYPQYERELRMFDDRWAEMLGGPIEENVALLRRLRGQGEKVYSITNFCGDKFDISCALHPFLLDFDGIVVSGREGLIKPDPAIFSLFLSRFALRPAQTLFIDDAQKNVAAARAAGMAAIHFVEGMDLTGELEARGLLK